MADRVSPVRINLVCQIIAMVLSAALCAFTLADIMNAPLLAGLVFAQGLVMGFVQPARFTMVYALVPREFLASAVAINSVAFNIARFIGPALAGGILVLSGPALAFGVNTLSFLAFVAVLLRLDLDTPESNPGRPSRSLLADMWEGARYALGHRYIGPLLAFSAVVSMGARPYMELFPGFADEVLGGGAAELAILSSGTGLGAVVAGTWLATRGAAMASARFTVQCAGLAALGVLGFSMSTHIAASLVCVMVAGAAIVMVGITMQTLLQLSVDSELRGRVMSLYGMVFRSGPAIGALLMGVASEWFGLQWPLAVGAFVVLLGGGLFWARARRLDSQPRRESRSEPHA